MGLQTTGGLTFDQALHTVIAAASVGTMLAINAMTDGDRTLTTWEQRTVTGNANAIAYLVKGMERDD